MKTKQSDGNIEEKKERVNVADLFVTKKEGFVMTKKGSLKEDIYWHVTTSITLIAAKVLIVTERLFVAMKMKMEKIHGLRYVVMKQRNANE